MAGEMMIPIGGGTILLVPADEWWDAAKVATPDDVIRKIARHPDLKATAAVVSDKAGIGRVLRLSPEGFKRLVA